MARLVLILFVVLQVADGLITYGAISCFGMIAEGNPLLSTWIVIAGAGPALFGAKLLACGCGLLLHGYGVHRGLAGLTLLYLVGAVGPWLHLLSLVPGN